MTNDTKITQHTDAHGHEQSAVRVGGKFATKGEREGASAPFSASQDVTVEELREQYRDASATAKRREVLAWAAYAYEDATDFGLINTIPERDRSPLNGDSNLHIVGKSNDEDSDPVFDYEGGEGDFSDSVAFALYSPDYVGKQILVDTFFTPKNGYITQISDEEEGDLLLEVSQDEEFPDQPKRRLNVDIARTKAEEATEERFRYRSAAEQMSVVGAFESATEMLGEDVDSVEFRPATGEDTPAGRAMEVVGANGRELEAPILVAPSDDDDAQAFQFLGRGVDHVSVRRAEDGWDITVSAAPNEMRGRVERTTQVRPGQPSTWTKIPYFSDEDEA